MKEKLQERLLRMIDDVTTAKFFVMVTSTTLLLANKLSQDNWIMLMMMIAGLKEAGSIAYNLKGGGAVTQVQKGADNASQP